MKGRVEMLFLVIARKNKSDRIVSNSERHQEVGTVNRLLQGTRKIEQDEMNQACQTTMMKKVRKRKHMQRKSFPVTLATRVEC